MCIFRVCGLGGGPGMHRSLGCAFQMLVPGGCGTGHFSLRISSKCLRHLKGLQKVYGDMGLMYDL